MSFSRKTPDGDRSCLSPPHGRRWATALHHLQELQVARRRAWLDPGEGDTSSQARESQRIFLQQRLQEQQRRQRWRGGGRFQKRVPFLAVVEETDRARIAPGWEGNNPSHPPPPSLPFPFLVPLRFRLALRPRCCCCRSRCSCLQSYRHGSRDCPRRRCVWRKTEKPQKLHRSRPWTGGGRQGSRARRRHHRCCCCHHYHPARLPVPTRRCPEKQPVNPPPLSRSPARVPFCPNHRPQGQK